MLKEKEKEFLFEDLTSEISEKINFSTEREMELSQILFELQDIVKNSIL